MTPLYRLLGKSAIALAAMLTIFAPTPPAHSAATAGFAQVNLVSDADRGARTIDMKLVNAWGLAQSPSGPFWVADNGSGFSTLYNANGTKIPLDVVIPGPGGKGQ